MHIDSSTYTRPDGKSYTRHLLRESYRSGGKVLKRTLANLSHLEPERLEALRLALAHKGPVCELANVSVEVELRQGASVAAVVTVLETARRLGIVEALGGGEEGRRALWQALARCLEQGSRLSAVRLARRLEADRLLGLGPFDEDDLCENLDWLAAQQTCIEDRLFAHRCQDRAAPRLFLYDVTRSYLDGVCNELGAFGHNRDGERGKTQVVVGLLTDEEGWPLSIELFRGNPQDPATVAAQIAKLSQRFGGGEVTQVEGAFRTAKTALLEAHPITVRLESRTRGHALVAMLAYMLARSLGDCWRALDLTAEEGLEELKELCTTQVWVRGQLAFAAVPQPRESTQALLSAAAIELSALLPAARRAGSAANRRSKLPSQRRARRAQKAAVDRNGSATAEP